MKKILALAAVAAGAAYARRKIEAQRSERDLYAAAAAGGQRGGTASAPPRDVWAAATDSRA